MKPTSISDDAMLAALGYRQEFKRDFSPIEVFGLGFSIIGILPSLSSVLVYSIPYGGPASMVWGWAVCSFFLVFIALAMAELGSAAPTAGGVYFWTYKYASPKYRRYLCWLVGYINSLTYMSGVAGINWGCAVQIMAAVSIGSDLAFVPTVYQIYGVFVALVISHAIVVSFATKVIARLQNFYILVNIAIVVAVLIALPAGTPDEFRNTASYAFGEFQNLSTWPNGFAFIVGFLAPLWTVGGFDSTVHIAEEVRNANTAIPWAIVCATSTASVLGWALNVVLAFNMGTDPEAVLSSEIGQPIATIFFNSLGKRGTLALWSFLILGQYMMGTSFMTTTSRQVFAFSRDGALPFSGFLYSVNDRLKVPIRAVWTSAFCGIVIGLIAFGGAAASGAIFSLAVVGQYTANATVITVRWLGGGDEFKPGPFHLGKFSAPVSAVAVVWMYFMSVVLLFPALPEVDSTTMNYTVLVIGGVILLATIYYFFPGVGGRYWFKGPAVTVDPVEKGDSVESVYASQENEKGKSQESA